MFAYVPLIVALNLWGFSFVGARWVLTGMTPVWGTLARFTASLLIGFVIVLLFNRKALPHWKKCLTDSMVPGLILGGALVTQIMGLQHTSVANSAFITTLYVVLVPVLDGIFHGLWPGKAMTACVFMAAVGALFMTGLSFTQLNIGDLLTLAAALFSSFHILFIGRLSNRIVAPFFFNVFQAFWAAAVALSIAPFTGAPPSAPTWLSWAGVLFLAGPVHLGAFTIQIYIQRKVSASVSGLLFLLESPLAALFAYWIFREPLTTPQAIGAALITLAAYFSLRLPSDTPGVKPVEIA